MKPSEFREIEISLMASDESEEEIANFTWCDFTTIKLFISQNPDLLDSSQPWGAVRVALENRLHELAENWKALS